MPKSRSPAAADAEEAGGISDADLQAQRLEHSYQEMFKYNEGHNAERVLMDIDKSKPSRKKRTDRFDELVQHAIMGTRCASALLSRQRATNEDYAAAPSSPLKVLKKFTETIVRNYHSPPGNRRASLAPRKSIDGDGEDDCLHKREDWERSQRSSGLVEATDEVELDIQRHLFQVLKGKYIGTVHKDFVKNAKNLEEGTNKTHADNVGLYSYNTRYAIQSRQEDQAAHAGHETQTLARRIHKSRGDDSMLAKSVPVAGYVNFETQAQRPDIVQQLAPTDPCTRALEPNPDYHAVDPKRWIRPNNNFLFENQMSRDKYYPGMQKPLSDPVPDEQYLIRELMQRYSKK